MLRVLMLAALCTVSWCARPQIANAEPKVVANIGSSPLVADLEPKRYGGPLGDLLTSMDKRAIFDRLEDNIRRRLTTALGRTCDLSITEAEFSAYQIWWNDLIKAEIKRLDVAPPGTVRPPTYLDELRALPPVDLKDENLKAVARRDIDQAKFFACVAHAYPDDPMAVDAGMIAVPPAGYDEKLVYATFKISKEPERPLIGVPVPSRLCLGLQPIGAFWDMVKEAENKGILKFSDATVAARVSPPQRPKQVLAKPACSESPPWLATGAARMIP